MKHIYAFEQKEDYEKYQGIIDRFSEKLKEYQLVLEENYALKELPKGIVWTTEELATTVFSESSIPAYTRKDTIYISPDLTAWRKLFLRQLEGHYNPQINDFYMVRKSIVYYFSTRVNASLRLIFG